MRRIPIIMMVIRCGDSPFSVRCTYDIIMMVIKCGESPFSVRCRYDIIGCGDSPLVSDVRTPLL